MNKIAFISVFHKEGIDKFAKDLVDLGWQIMSSSGTAKYFKDKGIECTDLATLVGAPILGHRVVSLSREFYAMLLARPDNQEDVAEMKKLNLPFVSLVCCDVYPLEEEISNPNATRESVIEKTDIGGPTMLRAGAKGGRIVICDKEDRGKVIEWLKAGEPDKEKFLNELHAKAEMVVAKYCLESARYHSGGTYDGFIGEKTMICKYGENAWQTPAFLFKTGSGDPLALAHSNFNRLAGEPLSYNNLADLDRLLQTITHIAAGFDLNTNNVPLIAIGVKHGNPCGASVGTDSTEVLKNMLSGDLRAIFGGLVMTNFPINESEAEILLTFQMPEGKRRLLDGIFAPEFSVLAVEKLKRKGDRCRFLANPVLASLNRDSLDKAFRFRFVRGGFLEQPNYTFVPQISKDAVGIEVLRNVVLAWAIGSTSNSNTITIVRDGRLLGNGVGQQDRVGAAKLAIARADDAHISSGGAGDKADLSGAVAYSDSFFPFTDGVKVLTDRGIKTIFATSGSVNDNLIIDFCKEVGVDLITLPDKDARGFAWH